MSIPEYPIKVTFFREGDEFIYADEMEMVCDLEWFDSEDNDPDDTTRVTDCLGREVLLKIKALELIKFELKSNDQGNGK